MKTKLLLAILVIALALGACTRSASGNTVPTVSPAEQTLAIVWLGVYATQTALANQGAPIVVNTPIPQLVTQPAVQPPASGSEWAPYESEGGIPYNGTTWTTDVAPDEIEVLTAGPACIAGVCLPGGTIRGSIVILLPSSEVIHYEVTGLVTGSNWHGAYRPVDSPSAEATWRSLAEDRIKAMKVAPNCTPGTGCVTIDVLVVKPGNVVVAQWTIGG